MSKEDFLQWLRDHPYITLNRLERGANIPIGTLKKALAEEGTAAFQELSEKHIPALVKELRKYGYKK